MAFARAMSGICTAVLLTAWEWTAPGLEASSQAPSAAVIATAASCTPTRPDDLGPFYMPNAPVRSSVGQGHVLRGVVRSAGGCIPIPGARIEFWLAGPDGRYDDAHRATEFTDSEGAYLFESNFPGHYTGRPPHIHVRVTAPRYEILVTQYYPAANEAHGTFDLVLRPLR